MKFEYEFEMLLYLIKQNAILLGKMLKRFSFHTITQIFSLVSTPSTRSLERTYNLVILKTRIAQRVVALPKSKLQVGTEKGWSRFENPDGRSSEFPMRLK